MLRSLSLAFNSLSDTRVLAILAKSVALTLAIFATLGLGLWWSIDALLVRWGLNDDTVSAIAAAAILILSGALLFRVIAIAIIWMFADQIVDAVEDRHYPAHAQHKKSPSLMQSAGMALRSIGRVLGYNLLAAPIYLILLVTGIGTVLAFLGVNALLLGRDLEDMLTARHGKEYGGMSAVQRILIGAFGTAAMLIPFVNLLVPVVVTAMAVHMAHRKSRGIL